MPFLVTAKFIAQEGFLIYRIEYTLYEDIHI